MRRQKTAATAPAFTGPIVAANDQTPIPVRELADRVPWWMHTYAGTLKLIREKKLAHVAVGVRRFVTVEMLRAYIAAHSKPAAVEASP